MKLIELQEGMEFHASEIEERDGRRIISPHGMREEMVDCFACDGSGKDTWDTKYPCDLCDGKGKRKEYVSDGPELQVSNSNGYAIQRDIFGMEPDYGGMIETKDLPALRRKLIKMINVDKERASMHRQSTQQQDVRVDRSGDIPKIGRGPTMIDMGRTDEQVLRYAHKLLEIVEYAMKHNLIVSWA